MNPAAALIVACTVGLFVGAWIWHRPRRTPPAPDWSALRAAVRDQVAADAADAEIERVVAEFRAELDRDLDRWLR